MDVKKQMLLLLQLQEWQKNLQHRPMEVLGKNLLLTTVVKFHPDPSQRRLVQEESDESPLA
jgi:hypothetical protein